jgi:TPR repeat protein
MARLNKTELRSTDQLMHGLIMLQNDPELVDEFYIHAIQGNVDAQYALGLIYAEGRGVEEDLVKSFAWLTLCSVDGDEDANILRQIVSEKMTDDTFRESLEYADDLKKVIAENNVSTLNEPC